jgi:hypothetical protein
MSTRDTAATMHQTHIASSSPANSAACSAPSKRELRRRSAIEPAIGHMKAEGDLGRCYLKGSNGDAASAILTAVGHNFRLVLA